MLEREGPPAPAIAIYFAFLKKCTHPKEAKGRPSRPAIGCIFPLLGLKYCVNGGMDCLNCIVNFKLKGVNIMKKILVYCAGIVAFSGVGMASDWDGGGSSSDWGTAANWDPDGVPSSTNARILDGSSVVLSGSQPATTYTVIGQGAGTSGTLDINGSIQFGTAVGQGLNIKVGNDGSTGTMNINPGADVTVRSGSNRWGVGIEETASAGAGNGTLNITGGTIHGHTGSTSTGDVLWVGRYSGSQGTVNHSGGTFRPWTVTLGDGNGSGTSTGTYTLSGGGALSTRQVFVGNGNGGEGFLNVEGGTLTTSVNSSGVGVGLGATGSVNMTGGTINGNRNWVIAREDGTGTFTQSGGSFQASTLYVGYNGGAAGGTTSGTFNLNGGTAFGTTIELADEATGVINVNGGNLSFNNMQMNRGIGSATARQEPSVATFNLFNGNVNFASNISIGVRGDATVNVSGGTFNSGSSMNIRHSVSIAGEETFFNQTGGEVLTNTMNFNNGGGTGLGTYNLEGGTLSVNTVNLSGNNFNWGNATLTLRSPVGSTASGDYSQPIGPTVQAGSVLSFNGDLATGYLAGNSTLDLGGVYLNTGVRQNVMTVSGDLDLTAGGDTLVMGGSVYLLRPFGFYTEDYGTIPLVSVGGTMTGSFDSFIAPAYDGKGWSQALTPVTNPADLEVNTWYLEQNASGVFFHFKVQGAVPEPSTLGLLLVGGLFIRRIRRK